MRMIPDEDIRCLEQHIYLPIIIKILSRDRAIIESGPYKFHRPYLQLIDKTLLLVHEDLRIAKETAKRRQLAVKHNGRTGHSTEYIFYHRQYQDARRYLDFRLRNRTEELIGLYFGIIRDELEGTHKNHIKLT